MIQCMLNKIYISKHCCRKHHFGIFLRTQVLCSFNNCPLWFSCLQHTWHSVKRPQVLQTPVCTRLIKMSWSAFVMFFVFLFCQASEVRLAFYSLRQQTTRMCIENIVFRALAAKSKLNFSWWFLPPVVDFIMRRLMPDKKKSLMARWCVRGMGRCKQTSVCLSKPAQCVSKVYLSSRTRWHRPARIKEVGLWPTLTFSALSTWNESAPSSDVVRDIGRARDAEGKKEQCGVVHLGQCFFSSPRDGFGFTSRINSTTWAPRKQRRSRSWSRSLLQSVPHILHSVKFLWN